jgi:hypothetical protein
MFFALVLTLIVISGGAVSTYLYERDEPLAVRLCVGATVGLTAFGLAGFCLASLMGFSILSLILATLVVASPLVLLKDARRRQTLRDDLAAAERGIRRAFQRPTWQTTVYIIFYAFITILLWLIFDRVLIERPDAWYTGVTNNYGDLPFHLSVITSFVHGGNFPPEDPEYAGVRFTYPFLADFVAAMFVRAGATLRGALFLQNFVLGLSLVGLLHRFSLALTRERMVALITPLLVLLNGGFGWWMLFKDAREKGQGIFELLNNLSHDYTIMNEGGWRWANVITAMLVPQRGILMGLPLAIIVFTFWWKAINHEETREEDDDKLMQGSVDVLSKNAGTKKGKRSARVKPQATKEFRASASTHQGVNESLPPRVSPTRRMLAAGVIAGLLPLVHAHSFGVVMVVGACLALLFWKHWRAWAAFFVAALVVAAPQLVWSAVGSSTSFKSFVGWQFGWDRGQENVVWFWFKNTGFFIPLTLLAILWRGKPRLVSHRLLLFFLPFTLCFIGPNLVRLAPWIWDNNKVIFYWYVASAPLVALVLVRLWRLKSISRVAAVALFASLTLAGSLDVWRVVSRTTEHGEFNMQGIAFAEMTRQNTAPRSLILHAPTFNHPVLLTGRRSLMGYPGHLWTHGLDYAPREADIKRIYSGAPDADRLLAKYGVEYLVVSEIERGMMQVNEQFFQRYRKVGEVGGYNLYKITRP